MATIPWPDDDVVETEIVRSGTELEMLNPDAGGITLYDCTGGVARRTNAVIPLTLHEVVVESWALHYGHRFPHPPLQGGALVPLHQLHIEANVARLNRGSIDDVASLIDTLPLQLTYFVFVVKYALNQIMRVRLVVFLRLTQPFLLQF